MNITRWLGHCLDIYQQGTLKLLKQAVPFSQGVLLDVGCGRKPYRSLFNVHQYVGVERPDTFRLTHDAQHHAPDCYYDGHVLPFDDQTFDTVVSFSVLEHTPEPDQLFSEMARVLKTTGIMIQHVPFSFRLHEEPHDYYRFSPHILAYFCKKHGMAVQDILPQGGLWSTLGHKLLVFFVFNVLRFSSVAQSVGKLGMEAAISHKPRYLLIPFVLPFLMLLACMTHGLEKLCPVKGDPLAFLLIARKL